jgi:hypothetical protein
MIAPLVIAMRATTKQSRAGVAKNPVRLRIGIASSLRFSQ